MANLANSLQKIRKITGNLGVALVDVETGLSLAQSGSQTLYLGAQTEAYAKFIRAKVKLIERMQLSDTIEEVVITSYSQYHMIYPLKIRILRVKPPEDLFFFVALSKHDTTLAQARISIKEIVSDFII